MTDFLSSLTNTLLPFDTASGGPCNGNGICYVPNVDQSGSSNTGQMSTGTPDSNQSANTGTTGTPTTSTPSTGFVGWFEGIVVQFAAILLGLILVAIALIMIALRNGPNIQVEGSIKV